MKCITTAIVAIFTTLATLAVAAPLLANPAGVEPQWVWGSAILQFEIDDDTFTSNTRIKVPGSLQFHDYNRPLLAISATIATTENITNPAAVRCQAFDKHGRAAVGPAFGNEELVRLAEGQRIEIGMITCY